MEQSHILDIFNYMLFIYFKFFNYFFYQYVKEVKSRKPLSLIKAKIDDNDFELTEGQSSPSKSTKGLMFT